MKKTLCIAFLALVIGMGVRVFGLAGQLDQPGVAFPTNIPEADRKTMMDSLKHPDCKYIGGNFINSVSGSLIARWPFESAGIAPYIFGGGGRGTDIAWEWLAHAGVGVEYRWNPTTGIFVDGRYVWADKTTDQLLLRAGVRFVF